MGHRNKRDDRPFYSSQVSSLSDTDLFDNNLAATTSNEVFTPFKKRQKKWDSPKVEQLAGTIGESTAVTLYRA